jgi:hypothetical protein
VSTVPYRAFYVPEDPDFTILDSALASIRYALAVCDDPGDGSLRCRSVTTTPDGSLSRYRGRLIEGVGYCADSIFAANHLVRVGRLLRSDGLCMAGERMARHAFAAGFFDDPALPVRLYRDSESGEFLDNLEGRPEYLEVGHIARVGQQLLALAEVVGPELATQASEAARRLTPWLVAVERCPNGWFPRRCTPAGKVYDRAPDALGPTQLTGPFPIDPLYDRSGAGCFVIQFFAAGHRAALADLRDPITSAVEAFIRVGGHYGSTNTDTEDARENVSCAIACIALQDAAEAFSVPEWSAFAIKSALAALEDFELKDDFNGIQTKGLLLMEESWNSACMWEIAMAAQAYLAAYARTSERSYALKGLTMLRAMAKHHHGELGFLTEAVDWDGHSVKTRHFGGAQRGDINDTHPFLNNLYIVEPTLTYLRDFAYRQPDADGSGLSFFDIEGNRLGRVQPDIPWLQ